MTSNFHPIFIVGTPRSGTTLASRILGRHPEVLAAGETHFFEDIWANHRNFGALESRAELESAVSQLLTVFDRFNQVEGQALVDQLIRPNDLVERAIANGGGYDGLYRAFTACLNEGKGSLRYCDDTPKHLFYLETIFRFFPEARVIICIRDPRDFLCSYKNFWRVSKDPKRIKALYHPIMTAILWQSSADIILNYPFVRKSDKIMKLRYESLVVEPEIHVRELCRFVGLDYDERLLAVDSHNSAFDQSRTGIFQGSVGKWTTCLTLEEVWWVQQLNQNSMRKLGYETAELSVSPVKLLGVLLSTPAALSRALKANSGHRGPLLPYMLRRLSPLKRI